MIRVVHAKFSRWSLTWIGKIKILIKHQNDAPVSWILRLSYFFYIRSVSSRWDTSLNCWIQILRTHCQCSEVGNGFSEQAGRPGQYWWALRFSETLYMNVQNEKLLKISVVNLGPSHASAQVCNQMSMTVSGHIHRHISQK